MKTWLKLHEKCENMKRMTKNQLKEKCKREWKTEWRQTATDFAENPKKQMIIVGQNICIVASLKLATIKIF
jgi:hypothetical protein